MSGESPHPPLVTIVFLIQERYCDTSNEWLVQFSVILAIHALIVNVVSIRGEYKRWSGLE